MKVFKWQNLVFITNLFYIPEVVKPLVGPFPCTDTNSIKYIGEFDDEGKPHGPGTITNYLKPELLAQNPKL